MSNKSKTTNWLQVAFGGLVVLAFLIGIILAIGYLISAISTLDKEVAAVIITAIVSVIALVVGKYYERKLVVEQALREKKMPLFEEFVGFWLETLQQHKTAGGFTPERQEEIQKFFTSNTSKIIVWAPDDVLTLWSRFRRKIIKVKKGSTPTEELFTLETIFLAMRKDIGYKNKDIRRGDILGLFVNDIDKYVASNSDHKQSED